MPKYSLHYQFAGTLRVYRDRDHNVCWRQRFPLAERMAQIDRQSPQRSAIHFDLDRSSFHL